MSASVALTIEDEVALGDKLFHDPLLSVDRSVSCASCHIAEFAFADTARVSIGVYGAKGTRNSPSVMNMADRSIFFYDGRARDLFDQIHFPIEDHKEMKFDMQSVAARLTEVKEYNEAFAKIYQEEPNPSNIAKAIASFVASLETSNTEFDAWMQDKPNKMSESAIRGRTLFMSDKAKCFDCHFGPDFTDDAFKNVGLYDEQMYADRGRGNITKSPADFGKFKVPGLRNIAVTAPYMHDGSFATLREVIDYYDDVYKVVKNPIGLDSILIKPLNLTEQEKIDLEEFLVSLTDKQFIK